jgi:hemerythrin
MVPLDSRAKRKILVLDDDATITDYLSIKLGASFGVLTSNDPEQGLALARAEQPDLVMCDVGMPGMDGYEFCRRMKADPETARIPVIFLTATRTEAADERRGLDVGAVDYLNKTMDRGVLEARIRMHLALREAQDALQNQNALLEARVAERTAELEASREALRAAMHNLRTTRVATGVFWVQVPEVGLYVLCGSPGDVVKHLMLRGFISEEKKGEVSFESGPNAILLSDVLLQNGNFANLSEFPVLQMLYRQGLILPGHPNNTGKKPILIGSETQVRAQLDYIYRGNYGLVDEDELRAAGLTAAEARQHMALKLAFAFGTIRASEDLVDRRVLGTEPVEIFGGVTVRRVALNRFEFAYRDRLTEVDLNLPSGAGYEAPYTMGQHPIEPQYFGVIHCGEGDGWDLRRQSMASIVMFQGRYYLVDAGPSVLYTLSSLGIDLSEIEGIFHTHAHDDHFAGLPTLLSSGRRIKYFATRLVRESVTKKLSALMSLNESLFAELFDVRDLVMDQWNDCDGMEVMPIPSPHPVETTVFVFRAHDDDDYKSYAHFADIVSLKVLRKLISDPAIASVVPETFVDDVKTRYLRPTTLKKIDSGSGLIHGEPLDFSEDASEKIVLAHRASPFSTEELDIGSQASFGALDVLITSRLDYIIQGAQNQLSRLFPGVHLEELNTLLRSPVETINAGSLILRRGAAVDKIDLLLSGSVERSRPGQEAALTIAAGELIGVESLFQDEPLTDTWRAASPVRLMRFAEKNLRAFLLNGGWYQKLRSQLVDAAFLRSTWLFGERIDLEVQCRIARASKELSLAPGKQLPAPATPSVHVVMRGQLDLVDARGSLIEILEMGNVAGEEVCLGRPRNGWRCVARASTTVLQIPSDEIKGLPVALWKMLEVHERRQRLAELLERR